MFDAMKQIRFLSATAGIAALALLAASCVKIIPVTRLTLSQTSLTLTVGEDANLTVTVVPDDATDKTLIWSSSDASVATVNEGLVRAVAPGSATITVKTADGLVSASCAVTVNRLIIHAASVSLDKTTLEMNVGDEETLTATVAPADADDKSVIWSSDNVDVATVANGKVTAVGAGEATITAKTNDGGFTATCTVTVTAPGITYVPMSAVTRLPDMLLPRSDFAFFSAGNHYVAVGGHTTGFSVTQTAEYFDGEAWHELTPNYTHDMGFSVKLPSGKVMIGAGCSSGSGVGQSAGVDIYDPATKTFSAGPSLTSERALTHAAMVGGDVVVSGNWYAGDSIEALADGAESFAEKRNVSEGRNRPYILQCSADDAMIFGAYSTSGGSPSNSGTVDFYKGGESFLPAIFENYKPLGTHDNFHAEDARIADYSYLIPVGKTNSSGYSSEVKLAYVNGTDFSLLKTDVEIPVERDGEVIYYLGYVFVDRARKVAFLPASNLEGSNTVFYILRVDYEAALSGGVAQLTMYCSEPLSYMSPAPAMFFTSDGSIVAAGGISNSNYSPYNGVCAFKPF